MRRLQRKLEEFAGPRWPRWVRLLIGLAVVAAGYVCYRWRLVHAKEFGALGIAFVGAEHGAPALAAMRAIKQALDPLDILNPGKILAPG